MKIQYSIFNTPYSERGYSLVEILIGFSILAIGLMFVLNMWGVLITGTQKITGHTDAAYLAQQLMEEIDSAYYFLNGDDVLNNRYRGPKKWDAWYNFSDQNLNTNVNLFSLPLGRDLGANPGPPAKPANWENTTDRRRWDDIDDYAFLSTSMDGADGRGPRNIDGNIIPARVVGNTTIGFLGFMRAVSASYAREDNWFVGNESHSSYAPVDFRTNFKMINITVFWRENNQLKQYVLTEVRPNTPPW